jgi:hypothetical protein
MRTMIRLAGYSLAPLPILCETQAWVDTKIAGRPPRTRTQRFWHGTDISPPNAWRRTCTGYSFGEAL